MPMFSSDKNQGQAPHVVELAATLLLWLLILILVYVSQSVLLPLLFSILIAISLFPLARLFEKLRLGRAFSAILAVLVAIVILLGLSWFIVYEGIIIGKNASAITDKVLSVLENGQVWLENRFGIQRTEIVSQLREQGTKMLENAGGMLSSTFGSLGNILAGAVLVPIFSFFLLYYRVFFREFFFKAFRSSPQQKVNDVLNKIYDVVQSY